MRRIACSLVCALYFILLVLIYPIVSGVGIQAFSNSEELVYYVNGFAVPIKDVNSFEPITVNLLLRGVDRFYYNMDHSYIQNLLRKIGVNESFNAEGIRILYNCSEIAGEKPITYSIGSDGWYWVSIPVGPCVLRNVPLIMRLNGTVHVKHVNSSSIIVYMNSTLSDNFEHNFLDYEVLVQYPPLFPENFNGSIEASLTYTIINNTAVSSNETIGFSQLYIVYPRNATEVKEVYDKKFTPILYGIPLEFKMENITEKILGHVINYSYITAYARSNRFISLTSSIGKIINQGVFIEYMEPRYKDKDMDLFDFYDDLALRVVIKHENVTENITYAPSKERYISLTFLYKNLSLLYNPDGKVVDYRWVYPLRFWGAILKLELSNGRYLWILFWGDVKYDENVDPYSIDIGYYSPEGPVAIDVKQMLLFIAVIVLPIVLTAYYVLRRR